jgi:predicted nuclease with TOPRIM domain
MDAKKLLELKSKIARGKTRLAELTGEQNALLESLEQTHGCKTIKDATELIEKLEEEVDELEDLIDVTTNELKEKYPELFT